MIAPTASGTGTGVASLEGLLVATLAEIISAGVDDDGALDVDQQLLFTIEIR